MAEAEPRDLDALFACLAPASGVLLAVSGGGDSTALAVLFEEWAGRRGGTPRAVVASIDHGLRRDAAEDVAAVRDLAARLRLPFRALAIAEPAPPGNRQAWARERRTALLAETAAAEGCDVIAVGHTLDDLAETFLIRLARGSGLKGLAAMEREVALDGGLRLVRPLLDLSRKSLREALAARGIGWREDPSNEDPAFARAAIRQRLPGLAGIGLDTPRLAATARALRRASTAIDALVDRAADECASLDPAGFVRLDPDRLAAWPEEIRLRLLSRLVAWVGAAPCGYGPDLAALEALDAALDGAMAARSLGGTLTFGACGSVVVAREPGRDGLPEIDLPSGETVVWDRRFLLRRDRAHGGPVLSVAPASRAALVALSEVFAPTGVDAVGEPGLERPVLNRVIATVPALWAGDRCVAIPALDLWRHASDRAAFAQEFAERPPCRLGDGAKAASAERGVCRRSVPPAH